MRVFFDSDVIIASLLSNKGAASTLVHLEHITGYVSNYSVAEINVVIARQSIPVSKLNTLLTHVDVIDIKQNLPETKKNYSFYTLDVDDAHIVAGAKLAQADFLVTYNVKHFHIEKIKKDFEVQIMQPGNFLQYLRMLGKF